ncbi:CoA transferase [Clostridium botulinum]|uniref:Carnitine dehydratase n=1 Tax=Clostridium botulinum C/D str. DC5 TaxID=1443128 RepID=A0A0A0IDT0_CLOBO|nr:CoA transferase [Clostridium botulinum]KEI01130.1 carnitine dehydratase [Clostridium botulinum C/D str. BKT75002]KEI13391.1 carnitine dehydratase [Clostridium botulinum C/D str. BKT2873]KGM98491.1 carnitine dehydratase [Clostridium botulinum C/D str. DC5]KOC51848.1 carnitine dehydratase [Clostridium botulinum]KOC53592.1 carnitine dehydratase [Clostridium botulinum]
MKPIKGLRVLDLTDGVPYIGSIFADYGADVIKVEKPGLGDSIRRRGAKAEKSQGPYWKYYMRSKKSITIDYHKAKGAEIIKRLVKNTDMIAFNEPEEKLKSIGLEFDELKEINPKLVYGVLTPFGEEGPWKDMHDYDLIIMARTGLLEKTGLPEKPTKFGFPLGYIYASWHLSAGMLAAYLSAKETGEGMKVSCSVWQTIMELDDTFQQCLQGLNVLPKRIGNGFPTTNPTDTFKCKNGWFSLSIGSDVQWLNFVHEAGKDTDWGEGTVYAYDPVRSMDHYFGELDEQLKDFFALITIEEADEICQRALVPGGPCNTIAELAKDPQVDCRKMIIEVDGVTQLGIPAKFLGDENNENDIIAASEVGADTDIVLKDIGISEDKLNALKSEDII